MSENYTRRLTGPLSLVLLFAAAVWALTQEDFVIPSPMQTNGATSFFWPHGRQCSPDEVANAVSKAVDKRILLERSAATGSEAHPFSLSALQGIHPCVRTNDRSFSAQRDVLFLVLGSLKTMDRVRAVQNTWAKDIPSENVFIVGDANVPDVGMETLPELEGKGTYEDAQHRTLRGLQYAVKQPKWANISWIFMVDDDTVSELRMHIWV